MNILKETFFENENSYGIIYQESNIQKIVIINNFPKDDLESMLNGGILEIRTCDFELSFDRLFFHEGKLEGYEDECEFRVCRNMTDVEANLRDFAKEFRFAFETNPKLKKYLSTVFRELLDYWNIE